MPNPDWQDPKDEEICSIHISGLQDMAIKLEESVGLNYLSATDIQLEMIPAYNAGGQLERRIYQAPIGKRNWLSDPSPVIKKNGEAITSGFITDYGNGAILLDEPERIQIFIRLPVLMLPPVKIKFLPVRLHVGRERRRKYRRVGFCVTAVTVCWI